VNFLTRAAARLWPPREAAPLTARLLGAEQEHLRDARAGLAAFLATSRGLPQSDPHAFSYLLRQHQADVHIARLNVRDMQQSYDWQTRPRLWQRGRSR
jgi:hypothetical protein